MQNIDKIVNDEFQHFQQTNFLDNKPELDEENGSHFVEEHHACETDECKKQKIIDEIYSE